MLVAAGVRSCNIWTVSGNGGCWYFNPADARTNLFSTVGSFCTMRRSQSSATGELARSASPAMTRQAGTLLGLSVIAFLALKAALR